MEDEWNSVAGRGKSILVDPATDTIVHFVIRRTQDEQAGLFASPI